MESREFRNALGRCPTGVTVVVARAADGTLAGLTANSVTPVTSNPPRLAWSLSSQSRSRLAFEKADYFAVNVLSQNQAALARQLASSASDRFAGLSYTEAGVARLPRFEDCIAWYGCKRVDVLEVGDHVMFIGDIIECEEFDGAPLLYYAGQFAQLGEKSEE